MPCFDEGLYSRFPLSHRGRGVRGWGMVALGRQNSGMSHWQNRWFTGDYYLFNFIGGPCRNLTRSIDAAAEQQSPARKEMMITDSNGVESA